MTLREKQAKFALLVAKLILTANMRGYQVTLGDAYRDPRCRYGHKDSLHRKRLAIDLNLFLDGEYLRDGTGHESLHALWEKWGGAKPVEGDLNHYSLEHEGMK